MDSAQLTPVQSNCPLENHRKQHISQQLLMMSLVSLQRLGLHAVLGLLTEPLPKRCVPSELCLSLLEGTKLKEISHRLSWKDSSMSKDVTRVYIYTLPKPLPLQVASYFSMQITSHFYLDLICLHTLFPLP